jgi:hypothetical protein
MLNFTTMRNTKERYPLPWKVRKILLLIISLN